MEEKRRKELAKKFQLNEKVIDMSFGIWFESYKKKGMKFEEYLKRMKNTMEKQRKLPRNWCGTHRLKQQFAEKIEKLAKEFSVDTVFIYKLHREYHKSEYSKMQNRDKYLPFDDWVRIEIPKRKKSKSEKNHSEGLKSNE